MKNDAQINYLVSPPKKPSVLKSIGVGILGYFAAVIAGGVLLSSKLYKIAQNEMESPANNNDKEVMDFFKSSRVAGLTSLAIGVGSGALHYLKSQKTYKEETAQVQGQLQNASASASEQTYTGVASAEDHQPTPQQQNHFREKEQQRVPASAGMEKG